MLRVSLHSPVVTIALDDPTRRNALGQSMFDLLDAALAAVRASRTARVLVLSGRGSAFCSGFDLAAVVERPTLMREFLERLSTLVRGLRRLDIPVIAAVRGPALAGGCALLSGCDFVMVEPGATLGYPVHRLGVSPAVTSPTLMAALGPGRTRSLLLSGELLDGAAARAAGLATHLVPDAVELDAAASALAEQLLGKGPHALTATKRWLNELDGSVDDSRFDRAVDASTALIDGEEARRLLAEFWVSRKGV